MPRTIVTTCGTSLYTSSCWKYQDLNSYPLSDSKYRADRQALRERQMECEGAIEESQGRDPSGVLLAATFDAASWVPSRLRDMPAELASLLVLNASIPGGLMQNDVVKLVHSSNTAGQFCAGVLATVLNGNLLPQGVKIIKEKVNGLDPASAQDFTAALKTDIWQKYFTEIEALENDHKLIFNLTGGYKATSMTLAALAALNTHPISIVYLHEDATEQPDNLFAIHFKSGVAGRGKFQAGFGTSANNYAGLWVGGAP